MSRRDSVIEALCQHNTCFAIVFLFLAIVAIAREHNILVFIGDLVSCFANLILIFATYRECRGGGVQKDSINEDKDDFIINVILRFCLYRRRQFLLTIAIPQPPYKAAFSNQRNIPRI